MFLCYRLGVRTYEVTHIWSTYLTSWLTGWLRTILRIRTSNVIWSCPWVDSWDESTYGEPTQVLSRLIRSWNVHDWNSLLSWCMLFLSRLIGESTHGLRESTQLSWNIRAEIVQRIFFELIWIQKCPRTEERIHALNSSTPHALSCHFSPNSSSHYVLNIRVSAYKRLWDEGCIERVKSREERAEPLLQSLLRELGILIPKLGPFLYSNRCSEKSRNRDS